MLTYKHLPYHTLEYHPSWEPKNVKGRREDIPVTVCIAAICEGNRIIMASDRMITTYGLIEAEPNKAKLFIMSPSVSLAIAGDISLQSEIIRRISPIIHAKVSDITTREVADLYYCTCKKLCFEAAQNRVLSPLGLTGDTFIGRMKEFSDEVANTIRLELMQSFNDQEVEALVAGVDKGVPVGHIFAIDKYGIHSMDYQGFAAIGTG